MVAGNYTICAENLSKGTKTLTLDFYIVTDSYGSKQSPIEALDDRVRNLYFALSDVSMNIEKLRTRESVHYESKASLLMIVVIKTSNRNVVLWNILKIASFVVVACIEVYMITDFFNKQEKRREAFRSAQTKF